MLCHDRSNTRAGARRRRGVYKLMCLQLTNTIIGSGVLALPAALPRGSALGSTCLFSHCSARTVTPACRRRSLRAPRRRSAVATTALRSRRWTWLSSSSAASPLVPHRRRRQPPIAQRALPDVAQAREPRILFAALAVLLLALKQPDNLRLVSAASPCCAGIALLAVSEMFADRDARACLVDQHPKNLPIFVSALRAIRTSSRSTTNSGTRAAAPGHGRHGRAGPWPSTL